MIVIAAPYAHFYVLLHFVTRAC